MASVKLDGKSKFYQKSYMETTENWHSLLIKM